MDAHFHTSARITRDLLKSLTRRQDSEPLLRFLLHYTLFIAAGVWLVWSWTQPFWHILLAMTVFGATTPSLFAMLHETGHRSAFASRRLNRIVATISAYSNFYVPTGFREFHFQHHRHTHDPHLDPEISIGGKPAPALMTHPVPYLFYLAGFPIFMGKIGMIVTAACGLFGPFFYYVPQPKRRRIAWEARLFLLIHAGIVTASIFWIPGLWLIYPGYMIGMTILSIYLPAEHSGLPHAGGILERTRSIRTPAIVKYFMWNMPYHAEHHAYPGVPYYHLPALSQALQGELKEKDKGIPKFQVWMFRRMLRKR
jgi:fatty acid desaturase